MHAAATWRGRRGLGVGQRRLVDGKDWTVTGGGKGQTAIVVWDEEMGD